MTVTDPTGFNLQIASVDPHRLNPQHILHKKQFGLAIIDKLLRFSSYSSH